MVSAKTKASLRAICYFEIMIYILNVCWLHIHYSIFNSTENNIRLYRLELVH